MSISREKIEKSFRTGSGTILTEEQLESIFRQHPNWNAEQKDVMRRWRREVDESFWRSSDSGKVLPESKASDGGQAPDRAHILAPLDEVFIDDTLKDDIVVRTGIPELLTGTAPGYHGVILFGPPGTGKTVLLRAISMVYLRAGAYSREVSPTSVNSKFVSDFAANLETAINVALTEAKSRGRPSFIYSDEGSILVQAASEGAASVAKHYQEALDVLKRYVGNEPNLVVGISTNVLPDTFEAALTREGRMTTYFIGPPGMVQRQRMWTHFTGKYGLLALSEEQAGNLAVLSSHEQGAFIDEFCKNLRKAFRAKLLRQKGFSTLVDALKQNANVTEQEIKDSITYASLLNELGLVLEKKYERLGNGNSEKRFGFK